jgi:hypothetical protein
VLLFAGTAPLLILVGFLLLAPQGWQPERLLAWTAGATLVGICVSIWIAQGLVALVRLAQLALKACRREHPHEALPAAIDEPVESRARRESSPDPIDARRARRTQRRRRRRRRGDRRSRRLT